MATTSTGVVGGEETSVLLDPNEGGEGSALRLVETRWGRLVDVYDSVDHDGNVQTPRIRTRVYRDFVVGQDIIGDGQNYLVDVNPFTETTELTILADRDSQRFSDLLDAAVVNLGFVAPVGLGPSWLPPFPLVPRNAAFVLRFSDLLDHDSIHGATVRLDAGSPPTVPFQARVIPDPNHGALIPTGAGDGEFVFRTTRVIVDLTVSEAEALGTVATVNSIGLPAGVSNMLRGGVLRLPTRVDPASGQFQILRNLAGKGLDPTSNGPTDTNVTRDVLRAFRPGRSDDEVTNSDPNNGFLLDVEAPRILGAQPITLSSAPARATPAADENPEAVVYVAAFSFDTPACVATPRVGDVLRLAGTQFTDVFAQVIKPVAPPQGPTVSDVRVELLRIPANASVADLRADFESATQGRLQSTWTPSAGQLPACFVQVSPLPLTPPSIGMDTSPVFTVRFTEPMDPASIRPFDTFRLARLPDSSGVVGPFDLVVGQVAPSADLRSFSWRPVAPLRHAQGSGDEVFLNLVPGAAGATDLGGNPLADPLPADLRFTVDPSEPSVLSGGVVLRFSEVDEDGDGTAQDPLPEVRGQFAYDLARGVLVPRPVARDSRVVDRTSPLYSTMAYTGAPIITPLAPLGSRLMTVWRYADVGYSVLDELTANIDVEGVSWAPFGGSVSTDFFSEFEVILAHATQLPDEFPTSITSGGGGYVAFPLSGLLQTFQDNYFEGDKAIVHPRSRGYLITPSSVYPSSSGLPMMPFPMNRGIPLEDYEYYTWRDTSRIGLGGMFGHGVDLKALVNVGALCDNKFPTVYEATEIRSLGLPLLIEIKCFPDDGAIGLNGLDTSFASMTSQGPNFRVFSTGGFNKSGAPIKKNPDSQSNATGGFTPAGIGVPGMDNTVMHGQLDTVVRVNRIHTRWLRASFDGPDYLDAIVEPAADEQPSGTQIVLAFRGATDVTGADVRDAREYDAYGDPNVVRTIAGPNCIPSAAMDTLTIDAADIVPTYFQGDDSWHDSIHDVDGATWLQVRLTLISNAATELAPELSTLAVPFRL